jgi:hypothetical protein
VPTRRKVTTVLALLALWTTPLAACGEDDVRDTARDVEGNLDDLSKRDLREALRDAEREAKQGGRATKREARELERKIERELESRK